MKRLMIPIAMLILIFALPQELSCQEKDDEKLVDDQLISRKLDNGFTYYLRKNPNNSEKSIVIYLMLKVGSLQEDDDQLGLAHFVEHMAFKGSRNFPGNSNIAYLEKYGVKFGIGINAHTGQNYTTFEIEIPAGNLELLKNTLLILRDISQDLLLESNEIDSERSPVLGEMAFRNGAEERAYEDVNPKLLNNSRYAFRSTLGTSHNIKSFQYETLRRFYKDWYRPDLFGLSVVGEFDETATSNMISELFSDMKNPVNPRQLLTYPLTLTGKRQFIVASDPDQELFKITYYTKFKGSNGIKIKADVKELMMEKYYNIMMDERYGKLLRQYNTPIPSGASSEISLLATSSNESLKVIRNDLRAGKDDLETGFKTIMTELERVRQFGFDDQEFQRAKKKLTSTYQGEGTTSSISITKNLVWHFTYGSFSPFENHFWDLAASVLQSSTRNDLNSWIKDKMQSTDVDLVILAPTKDLGEIPKEQTFQDWEKEAKDEINRSSSQNFKEQKQIFQPSKRQLVDRKINVKATEFDSVGVLSLIFPHNVKILLKKNELAKGDLKLSIFKSSLCDEQTADKEVLRLLPSVVREVGIGSFDKFQLGNYFADNNIKFVQTLRTSTHEISVSSKSDNAELLLEVIRQLYLDAALTDQAYDHLRKLFNDTIPKAKFEHAFSIYKSRFLNLTNSRIVVVGDFDIKHMGRLLTEYIATIPVKKELQGDRLMNDRQIKTVPEKTLYSVGDTSSKATLVIRKNYLSTVKNNLLLESLRQIVSSRIVSRLRQKEGGVYAPSVFLLIDGQSSNSYSISIGFECAPIVLEKLKRATIEEIENLKKRGPELSELSNYKEGALTEANSFLRSTETEIWFEYLSGIQNRNGHPYDIFERIKLIRALKKEDIHKAAIEFLDTNYFNWIYVLPKNNGQK